MSRALTVQDLLDDHSCLRAHGDALVAAVAGLPPADSGKVQDLRWALTREAHRHLVLDERFVQVPLENHPDPSIRDKAAELRRDAERFQAYWTAHIADWPSEKVKTSWSSYRLAVHKLITKMKERLDLEERELYPLLGSRELSRTSLATHNWAAEALQLRTNFYS